VGPGPLVAFIGGRLTVRSHPVVSPVCVPRRVRVAVSLTAREDSSRRTDVPLSEDDQRKLEELERQFHADDPDSARRISSLTLRHYLTRNCAWAFVGLLVGLSILLVAFASSWILGVFGFLIMVASAVILVQNLRRMSRLGVEHVTRSIGAHNLNEALDEATRKLRRRLRGDEE
jgi:hypothetical protein